ncbi:MAG: ABC-2 type transport system ATP-binding protein [Paraglaciecola sp.]|jgi:ABC-2 type transport system ATP-binding protein
MSNNCIETYQLTKQYGNKTAVNQLNLTVEKGGIYAFVGSYGAVKSTSFKLLLGVTSQTSGKANILGQDCQHLTNKIRGKVGYVNEEHTLTN